MTRNHEIAEDRSGSGRWSVLRRRPSPLAFEVICHCGNEYDAKMIRALLDFAEDLSVEDVESLKPPKGAK